MINRAALPMVERSIESRLEVAQGDRRLDRERAQLAGGVQRRRLWRVHGRAPGRCSEQYHRTVPVLA
jgi:hypothetical protein